MVAEWPRPHSFPGTHCCCW